MPQYLLSVWHDEDYDTDIDFSDPELAATAERVSAFNDELTAAESWVFGGGLNPASTATVLHAVGDEVSMTDGPYAESKELMGGFWVIEAGDLDAALAWARKATVACRQPVEVRPFQDG